MEKTRRQRNNEACKKHYDNKKFKEQASLFELFCIARLALQQGISFYHWSKVPYDLLHECGYIHDYNHHRKQKLNVMLEGNPIRDVGVDFVGHDKDHFIIGQSKLYTSKVSYVDAATWFAKASVCKQKSAANTGLLCTVNGCTTELLDDMKYMDFHHTEFNNDEFQAWIKTQQKIVTSNEDQEHKAPLRDYQRDILSACEGETKIMLNITCALGKTVIIGHYLATRKAKCVIVCASLKTYVENLLERLPKFCPDSDTVLFDSDNTSNIDDLTQVCEKCIANDKPLLIFTTFKSAEQKIAKFIYPHITRDDDDEEESEDIEDTEDPDQCRDMLRNALVVVDEIHDLSVTNVPLIHIFNSAPNSIFCTATLPRSIREKLTITKCIDQYDFMYALKNKYVVDYQILIPMQLSSCETLEDVYEVVGKHTTSIIQQAAFLMKGMLQTGSRRCIVFLSTKQECCEFVEAWNELGKNYHGHPTAAFRINDDIPVVQRREVFQQFEGDTSTLQVIASCTCLDQAVNLVKCDSTFITNVGQQTNEIRLYQRFMRAARIDPSNPNKKNTCFIWYEKEVTCIEQFVRKLTHGLQDLDFAKKVRIVSQTYDKQSDVQVMKDNKNEQINVDECIVDWVDFETRWNLNFAKLQEFVNEHGKFPGPNVNNVLNAWISKQKKNFCKDVLLKERLEKLRSLILWKEWEEKQQDKVTIQEKAKLLMKYAENNKKVPSPTYTLQHKKQIVHLGKFWKNIKVGSSKQLYTEIFRKNLILKNDYENLVKHREEIKDLETITTAEKSQLLLEYTQVNKKAPSPTYTTHYKKQIVQLGRFWVNIKDGCNKQLYTDILSKNEILKNDYENFVKHREETKDLETVTTKEKAELILEYVNKNKKVPLNNYTIQYKNQIVKLGHFWGSVKQGSSKQLYTDILSKDEILKNDYKNFFKRREETKDLETITTTEKAELILEYVKENEKVPHNNYTLQYKNQTVKLGNFWSNIKAGNTNKLYTDILSKNKILKNDYENFVKHREATKDLEVITPTEKSQLLIEFVETNEKAPRKNYTMQYKNQIVNLGNFLGKYKGWKS